MKSDIVVVDNVAESRETSASLLRAEGYEVSTALDGEDALAGLSKRRPSAVLFQTLEPAKEVIDFVRRLALSRLTWSVPVVVVTALNEFQLGSLLNGVPGTRKVLYSPCPPSVLRDAVAQAVRFSHR